MYWTEVRPSLLFRAPKLKAASLPGVDAIGNVLKKARKSGMDAFGHSYKKSLESPVDEPAHV
jgi:hypothetical protein